VLIWDCGCTILDFKREQICIPKFKIENGQFKNSKSTKSKSLFIKAGDDTFNTGLESRNGGVKDLFCILATTFPGDFISSEKVVHRLSFQRSHSIKADWYSTPNTISDGR
jgi:hypothetical protein